jgi:osmoprotectant transport system ATP-binding protein
MARGDPEIAMIELACVTKKFGTSTILDNLTLDIAPGAFCVLVGPSGCGKSTILRLINGLIAPDAGRVLVRGADIAGLDRQVLRRGIGYVIQSVGLFPHRTIGDNIATVPRLLGWPKSRIAARVKELAELMQLDGALLARYPHQLSGGQQQRIGVARALAADPDIVLMDEPFGALDPLMRNALQQELRQIHRQSKKTIVFVTHDMDEALRLGTEIAVMKQGRIVQMGGPVDLLRAPADDFVRDLIGGADGPLRLLETIDVGGRMRQGESAEGSPVAAGATLKEALALMLASRRSSLPVSDADGRAIGVLHFADILGAGDAR